jgi:hypothetical protein
VITFTYVDDFVKRLYAIDKDRLGQTFVLTATRFHDFCADCPLILREAVEYWTEFETHCAACAVVERL